MSRALSAFIVLIGQLFQCSAGPVEYCNAITGSVVHQACFSTCQYVVASVDWTNFTTDVPPITDCAPNGVISCSCNANTHLAICRTYELPNCQGNSYISKYIHLSDEAICNANISCFTVTKSIYNKSLQNGCFETNKYDTQPPYYLPLMSLDACFVAAAFSGSYTFYAIWNCDDSVLKKHSYAGGCPTTLAPAGVYSTCVETDDDFVSQDTSIDVCTYAPKPTAAPIAVIAPTTAPTENPTKQLVSNDCNYAQIRWRNGGASFIYPIDVCMTSTICSSEGCRQESEKYSCEDGIGYSNNWDSANCTGAIERHYQLNTQESYSYYGVQCSQATNCPYAEWIVSGNIINARVTGICYDCSGWDNDLETRDWCQNICNEHGVFQVNYGASNGDCSGSYFIESNQDVSIVSCSDPIILPTLSPSMAPTIYTNCDDPEHFTSNGVSCEWYSECLEPVYGCGENGYPLNYGYYFCNKYDQVYDEFSWNGRWWINQVKLCLQNELLTKQRDGEGTCSELKEYAYNTHALCYLGDGSTLRYSICDLDVRDLIKVFGTVYGGLLSIDGICQIYEIMNECLTDYIQFFDIVFDANYDKLQRELFDVGISTARFGAELLKELALGKLNVKVKAGGNEAIEIGLGLLVNSMNICGVSNGSVVAQLNMFANSTYSTDSDAIQASIANNIGSVYDIYFNNESLIISDFVMSAVTVRNDEDMDTTEATDSQPTIAEYSMIPLCIVHLYVYVVLI